MLHNIVTVDLKQKCICKLDEIRYYFFSGENEWEKYFLKQDR